MNIVSDEIVEKAAVAFNREYGFTFQESPWEALHAALKAVAGDIVQAEREALADLLEEANAPEMAAAIRARSQKTKEQI